MAEARLNELLEEAEITKRLLDRVPADKLEWRPHPKSMCLGQLRCMWRAFLAISFGSLNSINSTPPMRTSNRRCPNQKRYS